MNHPRYSVLNLFDPLNNTSLATPKRDVTTPDSGSDKENAEPSTVAADANTSNVNNYCEPDKLTMTAFFNRTYKTQSTSKHYSPVALRKRLIDVGDVTVTMDDASDLMGSLTIAEEGAEEDQENDGFWSDENMQLDDIQCDDDALATPHRNVFTRQIESVHTPQGVPRMPLADISLDATPVPRKTGKAPPCAAVPPTEGTPLTKVECPSSPVTIVRVPQAQNNAAPLGSPLASVINAINLTDHTREESDSDSENHQPLSIVVSEPPDTDETLNLSTAYLVPSNTAPLLTETHFSESIVPPSPPSVSRDLPLPSPKTDSTPQSSSSIAPADDSTYLSARPRPRHRSKTTSAFDPHRSSVDLHSSFNWQLQCPEASFDLINDRVSFFGGDSFMLDTTDDFDMQAEEEMMNVLAERLKEKEGMGCDNAGDVLGSGKRRQSGVSAIGAQDYAPSSPIVAFARRTAARLEKFDSPPSSMSPDSAVPTTVVKPTRRRSLLANLLSSPTIQPPSRRGSLGSPRNVTAIDEIEAPTFQAPPRRSSIQASVEPSRTSPPAALHPPRVTSMEEETAAAEPRSITPTTKATKHLSAPGPIHALRIVKRPKALGHGRTTSTSSAASASSAGSFSSGVGEEHAQVLPQLRAQIQPKEQPRAQARVSVAQAQVSHRPVLKGVQRPPPGHLPPPASSAIGLAKPPAPIMPKPSDESTKVSVKSKLTGVLGLRARVPESAQTRLGEGADVGAKSRLLKPVAGSTLSKAPSMALPKTSSSAGSGAGMTKATGIRPPSRFATVSASSASAAVGAVSGLPRPTTSSRLPAPSFGVPRSGLSTRAPGGAATVGRSGTVRR
ncbi:hypothetical protein HYDPIDRAFT_166302 [Hydnomerulius pinastri MD-312]|nr:hypothetical protein HYDPIDRAFT_166302 [Hydnomerulius pinastri MD-312]